MSPGGQCPLLFTPAELVVLYGKLSFSINKNPLVQLVVFHGAFKALYWQLPTWEPFDLPTAFVTLATLKRVFIFLYTSTILNSVF